MDGIIASSSSARFHPGKISIVLTVRALASELSRDYIIVYVCDASLRFAHDVVAPPKRKTFTIELVRRNAAVCRKRPREPIEFTFERGRTFVFIFAAHCFRAMEFNDHHQSTISVSRAECSCS